MALYSDIPQMRRQVYTHFGKTNVALLHQKLTIFGYLFQQQLFLAI